MREGEELSGRVERWREGEELRKYGGESVWVESEREKKI